MTQVHITETILRDAHQCLIATRMRTEDMLPICEKLDAVGFWSLECWGGATFDACLRFLKEDPWERLRQLRQALPNTRLQMLLRGQNILGYRQYPDDVVDAFVNKSAENGIDVFRIFDALNDVRNLERSITAVKAAGKHAQGTLSYTVSPAHTLDQFVTLAKQLEQLDCDSIAIKDMAGLLTPTVTIDLIKALQAAVKIPIHLHSHATSGLAMTCLYEAVQNGCLHVDTAISAFAEGASHSCTESFVAALKNTDLDTGLDLALLEEIASYFRKVRKKYHQFESEATGLDPRVHTYQVPGGMISNLDNQLREQNALQHKEAVLEEIFKVRKELGYPPLVTPTSQIVGTQAVLNVLTGERYKTITTEVKNYLQGRYGKAPGAVDEDIRRKAIGNADVVQGRPADQLTPELEQLRKDIGDLAKSDEDVLSYALFPDVAREYLEQRASNNLQLEHLELPPEPGSNMEKLPSEFKIALHGETYEIKVTGSGHAGSQQRPFYLNVDGAPQEAIVTYQDMDIEVASTNSNSQFPKASDPGHVTTAMPSTIIDILVKEGDSINAGDTVMIVEAMKMETEIQAPITGTVSAIYANKGNTVSPDDALMLIA